MTPRWSWRFRLVAMGDRTGHLEDGAVGSQIWQPCNTASKKHRDLAQSRSWETRSSQLWGQGQPNMHNNKNKFSSLWYAERNQLFYSDGSRLGTQILLSFSPRWPRCNSNDLATALAGYIDNELDMFVIG